MQNPAQGKQLRYKYYIPYFHAKQPNDGTFGFGYITLTRNKKIDSDQDVQDVVSTIREHTGDHDFEYVPMNFILLADYEMDNLQT